MIEEIRLLFFYYRRWAHILSIVLFLITIFGCAGLQKYPSPENPSSEIPFKVRSLIESIRQTNQGLTQLKGLGSYRLITDRGRLSGRMGWACRLPDQFRSDIFDFSGRPAATIAGNGRRLHARIKGDQKIYTRSNATRVINKIIGSPVSMTDITAFLSGRVPLREYYDATIQDSDLASDLDSTSLDLSNDYKTLILKDRFGKIVQEIVINDNELEPMRVVMYNKANKAVYEAVLGASKRKGRFTHFSKVSFRAENGNRFDLTVSRIWLDVDLPDSLFVLLPLP